MWVFVIGALVIFIILKLIRLPTVGKYEERYVLITGSDKGFGNMLAKRLDSLGFNVFAGCLTERGADELKKISSARLMTLSLDVTKFESIVKAREFVEKHLPVEKGLWAVVNNAGVVCGFTVSEMYSREDYDDVISVNLYGMIDVTRILLPLVRKGQGRIVNMSSVGGRLSSVCAPYGVSKFGVEAFSDCLRREVLNQGISVHIIEPAAFQTDILSKEIVYRKLEKTFQKASRDVQGLYGKNYVEEVFKAYEVQHAMASTKTHLVVDAYAHAISAVCPRYRYLVGPGTTLYWVIWNLPEWISDPLLAKFIPLVKEK